MKIIAVASGDPRYADVKDIKDANQHVLKEIAHFFATYKQIQKKEVVVGDFEGRSAALAAYERARKMYTDATQ